MLAASATPSAIQVLDRSGRGLRVVFERQADRYAHWIEVVAGPESWRGLTSVEGTGDQAWPASPPFQQLSIEEHLPGQPMALLMGMAGQSHWSGSVTADPAASGLTLDIACRVVSRPESLGSLYVAEMLADEHEWTAIFSNVDRVSSSPRPATASGAERDVAGEGGFVSGVTLGVGDQRLAVTLELLAAQPTARLAFCPAGLTIAPGAWPGTRFPATIRWKYHVRLVRD